MNDNNGFVTLINDCFYLYFSEIHLDVFRTIIKYLEDWYGMDGMLEVAEGLYID